MNTDTSDAARTLASLTWRRDFLGDASQQRQAYQQETSKLPNTLRAEIAGAAEYMHPNQSIQLDVTNTFALHINERQSDKAITSCYINISNPPMLTLQIMPRGGDEHGIDLRLECVGKGSYLWVVGDDTLMTLQLPRFILSQTLVSAAAVVKRDTKTT